MNVESTKDSDIKTLRELIDTMASRQPEAAFLTSPETGRVLTFRGLREQSIRLSARLQEAGLERGDKVAFLLDNGLFAAELLLGAMYGGFVAVPLNVRAGASALSYMLDHCDATVVYVAEQYAALINEVMGGVRRTVRVIPAGVDGSAAAGETSASMTLPAPPEPEDVALLMYTSGSTGQPKAAMHTHRTVLAHGANSMSAHQLTAADRSLLVLPLYHINAQCVTLIPTLLSGGSVVVPHGFSVSQFWDWLDDYRCTWSALVPTIISQLLDWKDPRAESRQAAFQRIRFLRSSSAPLSPSLHREFLNKFNLPLIQAMGSTEAGNIFSNPSPPGVNKIGSPGLPWGFETKIVNRDGVQVPAGEPGEILIRGPGMMLGYYKDTEGTAAVLNPDGWFHTGDLACRDQDGYFFIVGRSKELIIKGGGNIAPNQIDEVIASHPAVREAAAVGVPDRYLGEDLIAFVVTRTGNGVDERELLSFCESRLGHFKTPTRIRFVKDLPKGPSGKVQRLKLQEKAMQLTDAKAARSEGAAAARHDGPAGSSTIIEQTIAGIWAELFAQTQIDLDANFFALGGHSLLAIQCLSRLREKLPVVLSLSDFFENATVAQLAALVRRRLLADGRAGGESAADLEQALLQQRAPLAPPPIPLRDRTIPSPLSPSQLRLWFLEQFNPGSPVYNESESVRLRGDLDADALEKALNAIIERHEILRSTIQVSGEQPVMVVHNHLPLQLKRIDLGELSPAQRQAEVGRLLIAEPQRLYHLETGPGIRATLLRLSPQEHVFILMVHHIICDRLSLGVLWREMGKLYEAFLAGSQPSLPSLPIQYGDYAAWQHQHVDKAGVEQDLAFWKEYLRGAPKVLDLPTDRPRPRLISYRGVKRQFRLGPALAEGVRELSRREKTSLFTIFTAALDALLHRYSGQDDILIGITIADRDRPELQPLIGFFVDTQVLRTDLAGNPTFRELLGRVQKGVLGVYSHRSVPFGQVVEAVNPERNLSYAPLFQVMLTWRDRDAQLQYVGFPRLALEPLLSQSMISKYDLQVFLTDAGEDIWLEMEYSTDLFDDARIDRMVGHLRTLLEDVLADAARPLADAPLLTQGERRQILVDWNQTQGDYPADKCLHELFEEQARRTPGATAIVFKDQRLTYRQLDERASLLARQLQQLGVGPDTLVGICVERSLDMVAGLLGILKAGGAYVPLDPTYPKNRIKFMLEDARPLALVTQRRLHDVLPPHNASVVYVDATGETGGGIQDRIEIEMRTRPNNLAYVLYTSGSTGRPKGVAIEHRSAVSFTAWARRVFTDEEFAGVLFATSICFDLSVFELFATLSNGGKVILAENALQLPALPAANEVRMINTVPSAIAELARTNGIPRSVVTVNLAGEPLAQSLVDKLYEDCAVQRVYDLYGPTEATTYSTFTLRRRGGKATIGRPISNTQIYILDPHQRPVPIGVPGELYIGGDGLARGYLNRPELTMERFVSNPFIQDSKARLYKTGDLTRYAQDGTIEYLGRIDHQVKLRGFRIELGEIETVLSQHPGVKAAAVVAVEDKTGDKRLVAYVAPNHDYKGTEATEADGEHTAVWQTIWENTYHNPAPAEDPSFNTVGWRSSYDGQAIPGEQMREWVDHTVKRVLALQPKSILELGCGTGLLLFRLAAFCERYCGVDFSASALESIRQELGRQKQPLAAVTLLQRKADELEDLETGSFDAVILNSVVQYFPNVEYLARVVERASRAVKPGGFIFLGDVRNLHLLKAFCSSVQLHQAPPELPVAELRRRIDKRMSQEEELLIAPEFFPALQRHLPAVSSVDIQVKRGWHKNEMTLFRYDVVLHIGSVPRANGNLEPWDWRQRRLTLPGLREHLERNQPASLRVTAIPNARLQRELKCVDLLETKDDMATVSKLRQSVNEAALDPGIEPEDLWKLGEQLAYSVEVNWSDASRLGSCDAIFRREKYGRVTDTQAPGAVIETGPAKSWSSYANRPLQGNRDLNLIPSLRELLKSRVPEYMVPSAFVVLEELPLTPNGKVDRKALPAPVADRPELSANYLAPSSPTERIVAEVWAKALGLEKVGVHDNFFDLGGHSLLMGRVQAQVCEKLNASVSIVEMFQYPTISSLARHLSQSSAGAGRLQRVQERTRRRKEAAGRQLETKGK